MKEKTVIIAISGKAKEALDRIQIKVNEKVVGTKVKKAELASWLIRNSESNVTSEQCRAIRTEYRNDLRFLQGMAEKLRAARKSGMNQTERNKMAGEIYEAHGLEVPWIHLPKGETASKS